MTLEVRYLWHKINYISQWRLVSVSVRAGMPSLRRYWNMLLYVHRNRKPGLWGKAAGGRDREGAGRGMGGGRGGGTERVSGSSVQSDPQKTELYRHWLRIMHCSNYNLWCDLVDFKMVFRGRIAPLRLWIAHCWGNRTGYAPCKSLSHCETLNLLPRKHGGTLASRRRC